VRSILGDYPGAVGLFRRSVLLALPVATFFSSPAHTQSNQTQFVYTADEATSSISAFRLNSPTGALAEIPNPPFSAGNGTSPNALAVDTSGKYLYVANEVSLGNPSDGEIDAYQIDPRTGALTPTPNTVGPNAGVQCVANPVGIFAYPKGQRIYVLAGTYSDSATTQGYQISLSTGDLTALPNPLIHGEAAHALTGDASFLFINQGQLEGFIDSASISPVDGSGPTLPGAAELMGRRG
jgi:DNA-binding beta-propeller fold protein YncE